MGSPEYPAEGGFQITDFTDDAPTAPAGRRQMTGGLTTGANRSRKPAFAKPNPALATVNGALPIGHRLPWLRLRRSTPFANRIRQSGVTPCRALARRATPLSVMMCYFWFHSRILELRALLTGLPLVKPTLRAGSVHYRIAQL